MRASSSLRLPWRNKKEGYMLLELILSLLITFTLISMLCQVFNQLLPGLHRLSNKTSLYDVGHYMLVILEKNVTHDAQLVTVTKDSSGVDKLICQTIKGSLVYGFTCERQRLYKTIRKASSSGTNPLYVSDCAVKGWRLTPIDEQQLLVEITLQRAEAEATVSRLLYCINGRVQQDEA